ncbi:putative Ig domain-containing protein [Thalassotalea fonticola]|uniref:Ig domain-containing protein n=1 Tax=Thalassotalea fonticola TaxID=3065649 RepID=A0ABZ0GVS3_9GAMM|nr:putative Ig domain-containing protein [Colwelliaceae bacterium S1-1]
MNSKNLYQSKSALIFLTLIFLSVSLFSQAAVTDRANAIIKADHYSLHNQLFDDGSDMVYEPSKITELGAAFSIDYTDPGGNGMDAYLNGGVGGVKSGGAWHPGDYSLTGMPVQIQNLDNSFRLQWDTFQINAADANDKWWATINVIFDAGTETSEPVASDRDFDIVIEFERYEQDELTDKAKENNTSYWWFARNSDSSLKPFILNIDGDDYEWGVRYKFFQYPVGHANEHKNNKVHIKYIPIDNNNVAPYLDHPLKTFVDNGIDYIQYLSLPAEELALAQEKVADENLWIKSVQAGYEVYTGEFTIGNKYFKTLVDTSAPESPDNLSATQTDNVVNLSWDHISEDALQGYKIYRSVNEGIFELLTDNIYSNDFIDADILADVSYEYYVTAYDRSFNESSASQTVQVNFDETNSAPQWQQQSFTLDDVLAEQNFSIQLIDYVTDHDGDLLSFSLVSGPAWLSISAQGQLAGTPPESDVGLISIVISVTDDITPEASADINFTVYKNETPDPPVTLEEPKSSGGGSVYFALALSVFLIRRKL